MQHFFDITFGPNQLAVLNDVLEEWREANQVNEDSPGLEIAAAVIFNMFREGYQTKPALVRALQRHKGLKELTSTSSNSIAVSGTKHGDQRRSIE